MIYDFQLGAKGDILFQESKRMESALQFDFYVAKTNGLVFDFYIDNYETKDYLKDLKPQFVMDFYINQPENNKEVACIDDKKEYIYQQIKIRLNSALGTILYNENIGSELDNYRHMLLNPDKANTYIELKECVQKAIFDILPDAEIEIFNNPSIYVDFTNSLIVSISYNDLNYYYYL